MCCAPHRALRRGGRSHHAILFRVHPNLTFQDNTSCLCTQTRSHRGPRGDDAMSATRAGHLPRDPVSRSLLKQTWKLISAPAATRRSVRRGRGWMKTRDATTGAAGRRQRRRLRAAARRWWKPGQLCAVCEGCDEDRLPSVGYVRSSPPSISPRSTNHLPPRGRRRPRSGRAVYEAFPEEGPALHVFGWSSSAVSEGPPDDSRSSRAAVGYIV